MRALLRSTLAALVLGATGCMIITGSTDGYSAADSGSGTCTSASDCGGNGKVCCLSTSQSSTSVTGTCAASCSVTLPQLCKASPECGDAGACALQTCMYDGSPTSITFHACGTVMGCTASP